MKRSTKVIGWLWVALAAWGLGWWLFASARNGSILPVSIDGFLWMVIGIGILRKRGWAWWLAVLSTVIIFVATAWVLLTGGQQAWRDTVHTYREITSLWGKSLLTGSFGAVLVLLAIDPPWKWQTESLAVSSSKLKTDG